MIYVLPTDTCFWLACVMSDKREYHKIYKLKKNTIFNILLTKLLSIMNTKSFIISGLAATIVYFLLGWLFYGMLFSDVYPEGEGKNLDMIFYGCMFYAFLLALIFNKWTSINTFSTGLSAGLLIGLLNSISMNCFMYSSQAVDMNKMLTSIGIDTVMSAIIGGLIGLLIGKLKK